MGRLRRKWKRGERGFQGEQGGSRGYLLSGHGLMNVEEQRMGKETVGTCWFLVVVPE